MSKAKLIQLIKASDFDLTYWLVETPVDEVRETLRIALKEQDRDTRHGCAEVIDNMCPSIEETDSLIDSHQAESRCINYKDKDKDLDGL